MNNIKLASLTLLCCAAVACGGGGNKNPDGGGGGGTPSVSSISPGTAYLGSTIDVQISGSDTAWDATTKVDFGMGVTVNKITVASPSALIANISVATTAAQGVRTVTVSQGSTMEPFQMDFTVSAATKVTTMGTQAQGSVLFVTILNQDPAVPFDDTATQDLFGNLTYTNLAFTGPAGISVQVSNATPTEIDATVFVDVMAATGNADLLLASGDPTGTPAMIPIPAAFNIMARTATALTGTVMADLTAAFGSQLYKLTPTGANDILDLTISTADNTNQPFLLLLDKTGSFGGTGAGFLNSGTALDYISTTTDPLYVIAIDSGGTGGYMASVVTTDVALTVQTGGEGNDTTNNAFAGATALGTLPVEVQAASLSSATDLDYFSLTVPAGKSIHAITSPGDPMTDTTIQFFASDGVTPFGNADDPAGSPVDDNFYEDTTSVAVTTAGTYYIAIGYSSQSAYDATNSHYNLIVQLQ